jgi:hypothetical protein
MVVQKPQTPSNRRSKSYWCGHGRTRVTVRLCSVNIRGVVSRDFIRLAKVNTLFIAHHYRIRDRRHLGYIRAFLENMSGHELPDGRATLVSRGDCRLDSRGLDLKAS